MTTKHSDVLKMQVIRQIEAKLTPNTYSSYHDIWARTRHALMRLTLSQLRDFNVLLLCINRETEDKNVNGM